MLRLALPMTLPPLEHVDEAADSKGFLWRSGAALTELPPPLDAGTA